MGLVHALVSLVRHRSPPQVLQFSGILWGDTPSTVDTKLRASGFAPDARDGDDIRFHGRIAGYDGEGWVVFVKGHAVKAFFIVLPERDQVLAAYDRLRSALTRQYGKTRHHVEVFEKPFFRGDGHETEALQSGKALFASAWREGSDVGELRRTDRGLTLIAGKDLRVTISYEGPGWSAEASR